MTRPLRFFAARSYKLMWSEIRPSGSSSIGQVSLAISPARKPALTDSRIITRSRCGYRLWRTCRNAACTCCRLSTLACLPAISVLFGQHDGQHAFRYRRIARIRRMQPKSAVEIVELEDDPPRVDGQHRAIVLAPRIVLIGEVVELGDGEEHFIYG